MTGSIGRTGSSVRMWKVEGGGSRTATFRRFSVALALFKVLRRLSCLSGRFETQKESFLLVAALFMVAQS